MISFFVALGEFLRAIIEAFRDPQLRALVIIVFAVIAFGSAFYSYHEGWGAVDAIYFSVITLTTVGYGDLHPTTAVSKVFTVCYIFVGIGVFTGFITKLAQHVLEKHAAKQERR